MCNIYTSIFFSNLCDIIFLFIFCIICVILYILYYMYYSACNLLHKGVVMMHNLPHLIFSSHNTVNMIEQTFWQIHLFTFFIQLSFCCWYNPNFSPKNINRGNIMQVFTLLYLLSSNLCIIEVYLSYVQ